MKKYNNILVAVDGSDEGKRAFQKASELAAMHDAELIIAHVVDSRTFATIEQYDRMIVSQAEKYGDELLNGYKEEAHDKGVTAVKTVLEFGSPRVVIPKTLALRFEADLIISGATGLNAVERLLIGSVSEAITRTAPCDVLIVRNEK